MTVLEIHGNVLNAVYSGHRSVEAIAAVTGLRSELVETSLALHDRAGRVRQDDTGYWITSVGKFAVFDSF